MKQTAVILGMHQGTMGEFDRTRTDCDVIVFNEMVSRGSVPTADYVIQLHKPVVWRSSTNRNDAKHYEWLKSTSIPVLMQDCYEDVPASVKFPLDEIRKEFAGAPEYFTSSVAYALAYAIYKRYKRIELYGVEMETNTEYAHQRPGVAYWCGIAIGRGIVIDFHSRQFFTSPLYGYDGDITIKLEVFEKRVKDLSVEAREVLEQYKHAKQIVIDLVEAFRNDYKAGMDSFEKFVNQQAEMAHKFNLLDGAIQTDARHLKACRVMEAESGTYFLSRQVYEGEMANSTNAWTAHQHNIKTASDALKAKEDELKSATSRGYRGRRCDEYLALVEEYVKAVGKAGLLTGVGMESKYLMNVHDQNERMAGGKEAVKVMAEALA